MSTQREDPAVMSADDSRPETPSSTDRPPRLWPAIGLLILMWLIRWIPGLLFEELPLPVFMATFIGPAVCGVLILVWWLFFSRLPSRERWLGAAGIVLIAVVTTFVSHVSIKGMGTVLYAVPLGFSAFTAAFLVAHWKGNWPRTGVALLAALLGFGYWTLVRSEGVWGDFHSDQTWRWAQEPEQLILAELEGRAAVNANPEVSDEPLAEAAWPGFRGPERDAVVAGVTLAEDWTSDPPRELWRIRVGPGWSSFAVAGQRLFTQEQRGDDEVVVSYDSETGAELWAYKYRSRFWEALAGVGPRATPTWSEGRLFTLGAEGFLHRLEPSTGGVVWQADLRSDAGREPPMWGFSSSPLVTGGLVIVHAGGEGDRGVLAYDADSGALRWGVPAGGHSYSSPQISTVVGTLSVPVVTDAGLTLIDPADGSVTWQYDWEYQQYRTLQPLMISDSSLLISTGFEGTRRLDLSLEGGQLTAREKWTSRSMKPDFNDYVAHQGYLYGFDVNILACVDLETGQRQWKKGRYGNGQLLLLPDAGQLLVLAESGELILVRANPEKLDELTRVEVMEGKTWNHPVLVGNRVYVRNGEEAVGLEMPVG